MRFEHIAMQVNDLVEVRDFFIQYVHATSNSDIIFFVAC